MFEKKKVSHSEGKKSVGNSAGTIKMDIPSIDGLEVEAEESMTEEESEEEVVEEKKNFISFFKNLSLGTSSKQKTTSAPRSGCGCFGGG